MHPSRSLSSESQFGHDAVVGAFAVGPEEVAPAIVTVAADLWRRRATHVPARRVFTSQTKIT